MKIIGITGSSGSGKTTLSKILNERNDVKIIDADKVVREMSILGCEYLEKIKENFGTEVILEDGNLNRKVLADKIYNNNKALEKLNKLTFKYVLEEILNRIKKIQNSKEVEILIIDAPLLFEAGLEKHCNYVIALVADKELKIERICQRDNIDKEVAKSRLNIQQENSYYIQKADFVINNSRNCNLKIEIDEILNKI